MENLPPLKLSNGIKKKIFNTETNTTFDIKLDDCIIHSVIYVDNNTIILNVECKNLQIIHSIEKLFGTKTTISNNIIGIYINKYNDIKLLDYNDNIIPRNNTKLYLNEGNNISIILDNIYLNKNTNQFIWNFYCGKIHTKIEEYSSFFSSDDEDMD